MKRFLPVGLLLLPMLFAMVPFVSGSWHEIVQSGDIALLEMATRSVPEGVFTGAYSRFGFHHPGPMYSIIRYPLYLLTGGRAQSFYIVTVLIVGLSLWGALAIVREAETYITVVIFAAVFSFFAFSLSKSIWLSQWNPFIIIFPLILSVVGMASYSSGTVRYLPLTVVSASFAAQTHLGVLPLAGLMFLYSAVLVFHRREFRNRYVVISVVLAFVIWIPVLVDQIFSNGSGNLSLIYSTLREYPASGFTRVSLASWFSAAAPMEMAVLGQWCRGQSHSMVFFQAVIAAVRTVLLVISVFVAAFRSRHSFETRLCLLVLALIVVSLISVFSVRGDIYWYLTMWISVVSPLSWFSILLVFSNSVVSKNNRVVAAAATAVLVVFTLLNVRAVSSADFSDDPLHYHDMETEYLSGKLMDEDILDSIHQIQISIDSNELWPQMMGLTCYLKKQGYQVAVQQDYVFMLNTSNPVLTHSAEVFLYQDSAGTGYFINENW